MNAHQRRVRQRRRERVLRQDRRINITFAPDAFGNTGFSYNAAEDSALTNKVINVRETEVTINFNLSDGRDELLERLLVYPGVSNARIEQDADEEGEMVISFELDPKAGKIDPALLNQMLGTVIERNNSENNNTVLLD